jgi:capsular polysaccharide biosynthesis protein
MATVGFDREKLERLRAARDAALLEGKTVFEFEGETYMIEYAKYLIEYLDTQFRLH